MSLSVDCVLSISCQFTTDGEDPLAVRCEASVVLNDKEVKKHIPIHASLLDGNRNVKPYYTHRRRRRDSTVELSCVGGGNAPVGSRFPVYYILCC